MTLTSLIIITIIALITFPIIFGILFSIIAILGKFLTKKKAVFVRQISEENNVYSVYKYGNIFFKKTLYLAENKINCFEQSVYNIDGSIANHDESKAIRKQNKPQPLVLQSITKAEDNYHGRPSRH